MITTQAKALVAPVHDRMPVIRSPQDDERWLFPGEQPRVQLLQSLKPALAEEAEEMAGYAVSTRVSNPVVDEAELIHSIRGL